MRRRPRIAVAGGRAFTFRYAETTELLEAAGAEVVEFDPLADSQLPEGTTGLYLGGGFPEMHAADLGANERLRRDIRTAIARGLPTVAECAGLLYLCESVQGPDGPAVPMVGAIDATAAMAPRLTLSYRTATAPADDLLSRRGEQVTGHEFHRTHLTRASTGQPAWHLPDAAGVATPSLHASYLHTHWAGHPHLAVRFVAAAAAYAGPDLRHHGDREATAGLVDVAVNVFDGPRPRWLDRALAESLDKADRYPDPTEAEAAVARRHGRDPGDVLATAGAAEAFTLLARLRDWQHPVVVHPQFTEPEVALRTAGHVPDQVVLRHEDGFRLDPAQVPESADLVVIGNPTNPTGVRHPADAIRSLAKDGRLVVVDEAFLDDDVESLAGAGTQGSWSSAASPSSGRSPASALATSSPSPTSSTPCGPCRPPGRCPRRPSPRSSPPAATRPWQRPAAAPTSSTGGARGCRPASTSWAWRRCRARRRTSWPARASGAGKPCARRVSPSAGPTRSPA